jgi:hypothetical protein
MSLRAGPLLYPLYQHMILWNRCNNRFLPILTDTQAVCAISKAKKTEVVAKLTHHLNNSMLVYGMSYNGISVRFKQMNTFQTCRR